MMMRRTAYAGLLSLAVAFAAPPPGMAAPLDEIATDLQQQGYQIVEVRRTWLGRIQITAEKIRLPPRDRLRPRHRRDPA